MTNTFVKDAWLNGAIKTPSPNFNARPSKVTVDMIVIHSISLPPGLYGEGFIQQFFQNNLDSKAHPYFEEIAGLEVSSHFLIDREGVLSQFVCCADRAWHAGQSSFNGKENCNDYSIGIELEGLEGESFTELQYVELSKVCSILMGAYPEITPTRIVAHSDISPGRKFDPGDGFDWAKFRMMLKSKSASS